MDLHPGDPVGQVQDEGACSLAWAEINANKARSISASWLTGTLLV
jgi:hypothetical protein